MSMNCEVILRWDATPEQHRALGSALWTWCRRNQGGAGIYQYLDNQPLADLLAGRSPHADTLARDEGRPHVLFLVSGDVALNREALLESLRRALPDGGVADVRLNGLSWRSPEVKGSRFQPSHTDEDRLGTPATQSPSPDPQLRWS